MGSLEIQIFVSLFVILGAAFVALLCDFLKGNNERLRERNIELQTRHEERDKREHLLEQAQRQAWNVAVQAQEAAAAQLAAQIEEQAREEAKAAEVPPTAPSAAPPPDLAKAPDPQDDLHSHPEPGLAAAGPIAPVLSGPAIPAVGIATPVARGFGQEGPQYPEPVPLEVRVIAETPMPELAQSVGPGSGLQPKSQWEMHEQLLGADDQSPQSPPMAASQPAWEGGTRVLPSYLPPWMPQPVRDLLVRTLPMAGRVSIPFEPVYAAPAGRYWTLMARWPIRRPHLPSSATLLPGELSWAGLLAISSARVQGNAPRPQPLSDPGANPPTVSTFLPVLGVGITVGLRSGHLKPLTMPALALRASLTQLPLELPIPAKPVLGQPPATELRVDSELQNSRPVEAAEAGLVQMTQKPASIAPLLADASVPALPRVESRFPRFVGDNERSLPFQSEPTSIPAPAPLAHAAVGVPHEVAPLFDWSGRASTIPSRSHTLAVEFRSTEPERLGLPAAAVAQTALRQIECTSFPVSTVSAIPAAGLRVQPPAALRGAPGLGLSVPLPSQPVASSFYPFAPLLERMEGADGPQLPEQRLQLDEVKPVEPAHPQEPADPVVRIRVLQEEDLRPIGNLTPLSLGAPTFFTSTQRGLEFREEPPVVEEPPLEIEAGCTIEGGFVGDPVALQAPPKQPSRVVVMPAFDDLRAMFSPSAPSLQQRLELPGNLLRMPPPPPTESLPAGLHDADVLDRALHRPGPFPGAVMLVTIADHEKAVQQHGESAISQVLGDVQSFVTEAAGTGAFLSRTPDQELVFAWPRERVADPQPVFHAITEKLWDYQLRTLGGVAVIFSWGFYESEGDSFNRALGAAREQMLESRRPRRTTMTGVGRFRRLMVG